MKRTAVIVGVAVVIFLLGIVAVVGRPGFALAQAHGFGGMGGPGMHGMRHAVMGTADPQTMGPGGAGCPMGQAAALTPEQREERAKTFAEHYIERFLPGYTLEKKTAD